MYKFRNWIIEEILVTMEKYKNVKPLLSENKPLLVDEEKGEAYYHTQKGINYLTQNYLPLKVASEIIFNFIFKKVEYKSIEIAGILTSMIESYVNCKLEHPDEVNLAYEDKYFEDMVKSDKSLSPKKMKKALNFMLSHNILRVVEQPSRSEAQPSAPSSI